MWEGWGLWEVWGVLLSPDCLLSPQSPSLHSPLSPACIARTYASTQGLGAIAGGLPLQILDMDRQA
ncbi:MAG: hypothetical protein F6J93_26775 [Oscillatoria sp. SIO1A7]|nr:hypothetical protein [Oscillatoria sp. SIO1A7]